MNEYRKHPGTTIARRIGNDLSRRRFLAMTAGLLVVGAAGCGRTDGGQGSDGGPAVGHKYGNTKVPRNPERVVTVGLTDQDYVLALGVKPVGVTEWYGEYDYAAWPWAQDALGNATPEVMSRNNDQLDFERIAALEPDLIIGQYTGMTRDEYETASQIAPTVAQSGEYPDYGTPWQEQARKIGQALGKRDAAEELVSGVNARFTEVAGEYPQFKGKSAVVGEFFETFFVRSESDPRTRFLTSLGFVLPEEIAELTGKQDGAEISEEQLRLLDRDLLLWNIGFFPQLEKDLEDNKLYQQLDVAREGRDIFLSDEVLSGALTWSSVLSLPYVLDRIAPQLATAVDGDPDTTKGTS